METGIGGVAAGIFQRLQACLRLGGKDFSKLEPRMLAFCARAQVQAAGPFEDGIDINAKNSINCRLT